jgi:hypothetical protein
LRTQLALHIRFTEYTGIYNVRTGFVDKQDGELTAKMCGSPQITNVRIKNSDTNISNIIVRKKTIDIIF